VLKQQGGAMGRDEPGTTSDQDCFGHSAPVIRSPSKRACAEKGSNVLDEIAALYSRGQKNLL